MKKIPTLLKREFKDGRVVNITSEVTEGCEWVMEGEGVATIKYDGSCCAIIDGELYKRYDAKNGKTPPKGAIPCCEPDPITGHHPHWVKCDRENPADKWFFTAYCTSASMVSHLNDGTYEAVGEHFNGNPYGLKMDWLVRHGKKEVTVTRTFEGIRDWLQDNNAEGLVFWKDGEPQCKIKRRDFGFEWPIKGEEYDKT